MSILFQVLFWILGVYVVRETHILVGCNILTFLAVISDVNKTVTG